MAIQQSINQLISTIGIASGLYAHLPEVQEDKARDKELKNIIEQQKYMADREARANEFIASDEFSNAMEGVPDDIVDKIVEGLYGGEEAEKAETLRQRRMELDPKYRDEERAKEERGTLTKMIFRGQEEKRKAAKEEEKRLAEEDKRLAAEKEEKKKQEELKAKIEEEQKLQEKRDLILHNIQPTKPREVLKGYGI